MLFSFGTADHILPGRPNQTGRLLLTYCFHENFNFGSGGVPVIDRIRPFAYGPGLAQLD